MLYFLIVIIALFSLPYIRFFFKRVLLLIRIRRICKKKNYNLQKAHIFWFLGSKRSKKCDVYIETANQLFAIKLFGIPKRRTILVFKENGEHFIRSFIAIVSFGSAIHFPINSKPKPMPAYNFRYKYRDEWEIKTPRRILLVNPVSMEFRLQPQHGNEVIVGAGEIVNSMEIHSLPRLLEDLENAL